MALTSPDYWVRALPGGRSGWTRTIDLGNNACVVSYPGARFCVPARIPDVSYPLLVGLDGLEPSTSRLSGARSNHLSYRPFYSFMAIRFESSFAELPLAMVEMKGI